MSDRVDESARIKPLTSKSDYGLWRVRSLSACSKKGVADVFEPIEGDSPPDAEYKKRMNTARDIIVSALGDDALRVVQTVVGKPKEMVERLDARYRSTSTAAKISKITELVSERYKTVRQDMAKHVDRMAGIIEELKNMGLTLDATLTVGLLLESVEASELTAVAAAIKTQAETELKWESVTARLIE